MLGDHVEIVIFGEQVVERLRVEAQAQYLDTRWGDFIDERGHFERGGLLVEYLVTERLGHALIGQAEAAKIEAERQVSQKRIEAERRMAYIKVNLELWDEDGMRRLLDMPATTA